jgi:Transcriptional regulator PadR-like family
MGKPTDLIQGTLDLLILKTIALEPMHGWAIAQRIRQLSKEVLQVNQGALYPALHPVKNICASSRPVGTGSQWPSMWSWKTPDLRSVYAVA